MITSQPLNRETAEDLLISREVLAEVHFPAVDPCCSPEAPCRLAAFHLDRIARIEAGAVTPGTIHLADVRVTDRPVVRPAAGTRAANQYGVFKVVEASEAQVRYITRLLDERDLTSLPAIQEQGIRIAREQLAAGHLSKKAAMAALDYLCQLPVRADVPVRRASEKQVALIARLSAERGATYDAAATAAMSPKEASAAIDALFALPKVARPAAEELAIGMYRKADGTMYRVYPGRESHRILAKQLVPEGDGWGFEYAGLASRFVVASERMSLEEAKAWGADFGTCCVCAALLTDPTSVAAGIGPKCAKNV